MLSAHPRISIQWAIIVKYAFIHLECHRSHVKASFTSFQLLSLLNLLINSTYKLDISESIQCTSQQNCNTSLHCNNTNHMSTTIKIVADKENKTINGRKKSELHLKKPGSNTCKMNSVPLWRYPSPKVYSTWGPSFSSKPQT